MPDVGDFVSELEEECEAALREVVEGHIEDLPPHITHLMAKAAVTVLEAIIEPDESDEPDEFNEEHDEPMEDV